MRFPVFKNPFARPSARGAAYPASLPNEGPSGTVAVYPFASLTPTTHQNEYPPVPELREKGSSGGPGRLGWQGRGAAPAEDGRFAAGDKRNVQSELLPGDYKGYRRTDSTDSEHDDVTLVTTRFRDACMYRRSVERDWVLSCAQVEGRQWLRWDDATLRAVSIMNPGEETRYVTHNLTRPLIAKVIAMATMTKPDADVAPDSDAEMDRDAASEARGITAHLARIHGQAKQMQEVCSWAAICGVGYTKHFWDASAYADVPRYGPDGRIVGKQSLPVGEEQEHVIPPFELYVDPVAKTWEQAQWVIHASIKPLSYFVERFGEVGKEVRGMSPDAYADFGTMYTTSGYGSASQLGPFWKGTQDFRAAQCLEMWEKPTPRYPEGRLIIVSGTVRLYRGPWPMRLRMNGKPTFPFARVVYQEAVGHPYGRGLVADLAPIQMEINRIASRITERMDEDKLTVVLPKGAQIGADAYDGTDESRHVRKIYYDRVEGDPPQFQNPPPLSPGQWELIGLCWQHMQEIAGVHDISRGSAPPGITAGIAIQLLQQGDQTQLSQFTGNIENYTLVRNSIQLALYAQYAEEDLPRMMGVDNAGNAQTSARRAMAFRALSQGGSCSVYVVPGSATPKSPAGQQQEVMDYLKAGLFGPPGSPQAGLVAVKLLDLAKSDLVTEYLLEQVAHERAMQPSPADLATQQHAQTLAQQEQQLQFQAQLLQVKNQAAEQLAGALAAIKEQIAEQAAQAKAARELQQLQEEHRHATVMAWFDKVTPTLTGRMDAAAVAELEGKLGLGDSSEL